jgi:hypothetical protein
MACDTTAVSFTTKINGICKTLAQTITWKLHREMFLQGGDVAKSGRSWDVLHATAMSQSPIPERRLGMPKGPHRGGVVPMDSWGKILSIGRQRIG